MLYLGSVAPSPPQNQVESNKHAPDVYPGGTHHSEDKQMTLMNNVSDFDVS